MREKTTVWMVTEAYYPDEVGTAYYMTKLSEGLAASFDVRVLCGYPRYNARGQTVPRREIRNSVRVERCRATLFDKDVFLLRLVNLAAVSLSIFLKAVARIRRGDVVIVVTSPPSLPFVTKFACSVRGAKCIMRIDDVYPEILIATGILKPDGLLAGLIGLLNTWIYRRMDALVVLGRDMKRLASAKVGRRGGTIAIVPNWADIAEIYPEPKSENSLLAKLRLSHKFVVLCAGNMGRAQAVESIFQAAERLRSRGDIHFLFIGSGAKRSWMDAVVVRSRLENISILDQRPRSEQNDFLNACDVNIVTLLPGMAGAGVPSRMYNAMAAGKPIIALAPPESEVSEVVLEEGLGWVVSPDGPDQLVDLLLRLKSLGERLPRTGRCARRIAETKYSPERTLNEYRQLIDRVRSPEGQGGETRPGG